MALGNTGSQKRDKAQKKILKKIKSTKLGETVQSSVSELLAIRTEAALNTAYPDENEYTNKYKLLLKGFKNADSDDISKKLNKIIQGALKANVFVKDLITSGDAQKNKEMKNEMKNVEKTTREVVDQLKKNDDTKGNVKTKTSENDDKKKDDKTKKTKKELKVEDILPNKEKEGKKSDSTYYFFKSTPKEEAHKYKPKIIEQVVKQEKKKVGGTQLSAWNTGSLWESKDWSKLAKESLKKILKEEEFKLKDGGSYKVTDFAKFDGSASCIFNRGVKRVWFDFRLTLNVDVEINEKKTSGKIGMNVDSTEVPSKDFDIKVTGCTDSDTKNILKRNNDLMYDIFLRFYEFLKQH